MSDRTEALLARIGDAKLRDAIRTELRAHERQFGLVFENHLPETVRLPKVAVRRGSKVVHRDRPATGREEIYRAQRLRGRGPNRVAVLMPIHPDADDREPLEVPISDLVVVAEFGDPVFPGLSHRQTVEGPETNDDAPAHVVINAENFHALQALKWSHEETVDLIYIDPPYNTGNKTWQYNDHYVAEQDGFRHSKWLSFMERRLLLARQLLTQNGVIIVAIGDEEHHRLRMLMDQVFGEQNFLSNVVWQGGRKNDSRYISNGADYMLIYARNEQSMRESGIKWRESKRGLDLARSGAVQAWADSAGDPEIATKLYRKYLKRHNSEVDAGVARFNNIDEHGRVFNSDRDLTWPGGGGPRYTFPHPDTRRDVPIPSRGWLFQKERMLQEIAEDKVVFGPDETKIPRGKSFLDDVDSQVVSSVFDVVRTRASQHLYNRHGTGVFPDKRFPFPKDHEVLMRWIRLVASKDAVVLDFFGGSGTTAEAVLRLNAEDGGTRQCVVVTNNELAAKDDQSLRKKGHRPGDAVYEAKGVFENVTWPRLKTVVTGVREDGSVFSDGIPGRVAFFDLEYLDEPLIEADLAFEAVLPMLWLRSGALGQVPRSLEHSDGPLVHRNIAVLRDIGGYRQSLVDWAGIEYAYIVSESPAVFSEVAAQLSEHVRPVHLYTRYLTTFAINTPQAVAAR